MSNYVNYSDYNSNRENADMISYATLYGGRRNNKTMDALETTIKNTMNRLASGYQIADVIFNNPATIVIWADGSKTVVKCRDDEEFDPEKGLAMAISKKMLGNKYNYYDVFKKYIGKYIKMAKKKRRDDQIAKAKILRADGKTLKEIADTLNLTEDSNNG